MKHPISLEEAEAFAEKYGAAEPDVVNAQFQFLTDFELTDTWEDMTAKLESQKRIIATMCRLAGVAEEPTPQRTDCTEEEKARIIQDGIKRLTKKSQ